MPAPRARWATAVVLAAALLATACEDDGPPSDAAGGWTTYPGAEPLLNSERIEQRFGSYGIEVIEQDEVRRVSDLYSGEGADRTTRTLAVVSYPVTTDPAYATEHEAIVAGGSIGSTFRDAGWTIDKIDTHIGALGDADAPSLAFALMQIEPQPLALHVYRFDVTRDGETFAYATIAEMHHPDYLDEDAVVEIFGDVGGSLTDAEVDAITAAVPVAVP